MPGGAHWVKVEDTVEELEVLNEAIARSAKQRVTLLY